ncbi:MAG: tetratricopeptide repeat protein [Nitrospira sp.]|nr:tetratricopeptide repeat protein [Nitrospira sp.]
MKIKKKSAIKKDTVTETETERLQGLYDDLTFKVGDSFEKNRTIILASVSVLVVLCIGVIIYYYMSGRWNKEASALESTAYNYYVEGDYKDAISSYQKIVDKFSSSKNAPIALYYLGNSYLGMGQTDEAIKAYQKIIEKYKSEKTVFPLAYINLGYAYMNKKDYANAISVFKQISLFGNSLVADRAVYETALAYEASGDKASAKERYEYLKKAYPNSPWTQDAIAKLNKIQGIAVTPQPQSVSQPAKIEPKGKK